MEKQGQFKPGDKIKIVNHPYIKHGTVFILKYIENERYVYVKEQDEYVIYFFEIAHVTKLEKALL